MGLQGQRVNRVEHHPDEQTITIYCDRDQRCRVVDPRSGQTATVNRYVRRRVRDLPLWGQDCWLEIELAQVMTGDHKRRMEACEFIDTGVRFTRRFCRLVGGLCRHMSIQAVALHLGLRWETVKNMDKTYLQHTLPSLDASQLKGLKYIGVDEVARAKGHDYMTVTALRLEGWSSDWCGNGPNGRSLVWVSQAPTSRNR